MTKCRNPRPLPGTPACELEATETVGARSLCADHAVAERMERDRRNAWIAELESDPAFRAECERELAWEGMVS